MLWLSFLYAWGSTLLELPKSATLPMIGFLAIMFGAMAFALYQSGRRRTYGSFLYKLYLQEMG